MIVVTRTIFRRRDDVAACLADLVSSGALEQIQLGDAGWLRVDRALEPACASSTMHVRARLHGRRPRLVRSIQVEISLAGWSDRAIELSLRPTARRPGQWGARRLNRYFRLAHLAADQLAATLRCPDPSEMHALGSGVVFDVELSAAA